MTGNTDVRVAIVGVGNCASSLVQGVQYYQDADEHATVPGLMHVRMGPYHVRDVKFVAALDVDAKKVGFDLSEAIFASENNTIKIADVPPTNVLVQRGPTLDGIGKYYADTIELSDVEPVDVVKVLKENSVDVLVSYLPVGSEEADKFYAQCAIDAKVGFVNALPVFIASDPVWAKKFEEAGVPIVGDDIKSQVGATITHRVLAKLFEDRGVELLRTYQLNFGGNMDFMNMLERKRLMSKKISKTQAVTSQVPHEMEKAAVHIGPSDHVPWLDDRKFAYVRLEGKSFGDVPLNLEYKLEVWDSPNSAGVIIDAIRAAKIAKDRGIGGPVISASSYFMKSPPEQYGDDVCRDLVEKFILGEVARYRPLATPPKLEGVANGSKSAVWADLRGVLAGRDFRRLFATRLISQAGDGVVTAGVGTYVFFNATTFPSPAAGAAAFAVLYLPYSLIGPFAGVFIDRWSRRQILVWSALVRSLFVALTAAFMGLGNRGVLLYVAVLLVLGVNRFFLSSLSAALPHVVAEDKLVMANSVSPTAGGISATIGGVVALGLNVATGNTERGAAITLLVGGGCYVVASLVAATMARDRLRPGRPPGE